MYICKVNKAQNKKNKIMNILQKIEKIALDNNSEFKISNDKRTRIFYSKTDKNIYKIISCGNNHILFKKLCDFLVQDKSKCNYFQERITGYFATYTDENFTLKIETNFNGYNTICVYKK